MCWPSRGSLDASKIGPSRQWYCANVSAANSISISSRGMKKNVGVSQECRSAVSNWSKQSYRRLSGA